MKRCNKCNLIMGDGAKVCSSCGNDLVNNFTYICNNCGQVDFNETEKCTRCGAPTIFAKALFNKESKATATNRVAKFVSNVQDVGNNIPVDEYKDKAGVLLSSLKEKADHISIEDYKKKAGQVIDSAKDAVSEIPVDEFKEKAGKAYDSAKGMIKEIPVEKYQENAKQAINSAKDVVSEIPVDEFKKKAGKVYDSAKGMINEIPVKGYQEKAKQAINSAKNVVSEIPVDEFKGKTGKAYDSAEGMIKEIPSEDYQEKVEQAINSAKNPLSDDQVDECKAQVGQKCNVITEKGIDTYVKDSADEVGKGSSLQRKESYNDTNTEKSFFSKYKQFIFGAVTVIALFGVYQLGVYSTSKKNVENTSEQAITSVKPSSKTVNHNESSKSIIDKSAEGKAYTARLLKKYGINRQVLATSYGNNSAGFVALLYDGSEQQIAIIDKSNDRFGIADLSESLFDMENNAQGIVEVNIMILNDTKDADKDSGIWQGAHHLFPIHAQYKSKNDGQIEPGMIKTSYRNSMKYDQYLQEAKNVDMVNLLLTETPVMMRNYIEEAQKRK